MAKRIVRPQHRVSRLATACALTFSIGFIFDADAYAATSSFDRQDVIALVQEGRTALAARKGEEAREFYQKALALAESGDDYLAAAALHNLIGETLEDARSLQGALEYYERGTEILRTKHVSNSREYQPLPRLGVKGYVGGSGEPVSVDLYRGRVNDLKPLLDKLPADSHQELLVLLAMNAGNMYLSQEQYEQAEQYYRQALVEARKQHDQLHESEVLTNLAWSALKQHQLQDAHHRLEEVFSAISTGSGTTQLRRAILALGVNYREQKEFTKAVMELGRAVTLYKSAGDSRGTGRAKAHLATAYLQTGDLDKAKSGYLEALALNESLQDDEIAWSANGGLAKTYAQQDEYALSLKHYQAYWDTVLRVGEYFHTDPGRTSFLEDQDKMFEDYARVAMKIAESSGNYTSARQVIEQRRSRMLERLVYSLRTFYQNYDETSAPGHLPAAYALGNSTEYENWCGAPAGTNESPRKYADCSPESEPATKLSPHQLTPPPTSPKATYLEYYALGDQLAVFVKTESGDIHGTSIKIGSDELNASVDQYIHALGVEGVRGLASSRTIETVAPAASRPSLQNWGDLSRRLYALLIEPIERFLPNDEKLPVVIVPHQALWKLPFASLQDKQNQYFNDRHILLYVPSEPTWQLASSRPRERDHRHAKAWVVGNPRMPQSLKACNDTFTLSVLPGAQAEAEAVARLFKDMGEAELFVDSQADRLRFQAWYRNYSVLHLATHGLACPQDPLESFVVLTDLTRDKVALRKEARILSATADARLPITLDINKRVPYDMSLEKFDFQGRLSMRIVLTTLKLNADLVTLSACQTGLGKLMGEGMIGFPRAFLAAGARSLLASLWSVDDEATKDLMIAFYRQYLEHGNKGLALQQAMEETRRLYPSPSSWAAFALYGLTE